MMLKIQRGSSTSVKKLLKYFNGEGDGVYWWFGDGVGSDEDDDAVVGDDDDDAWRGDHIMNLSDFFAQIDFIVQCPKPL